MCFGSPSTPDYGAQAAEAEAKRQAAISEGTDTVNKNFEKFTPGYYEGLGQAFRSYYRPQVDKQAKDARRAVTLGFANNPNSSASNRRQADLQTDYDRALAGVGTGAIDAQNAARQQVEGARGSLLNLVNAGSGLENVAQQSSNFAQTYAPPTSFSPLGDMFAKYANNTYLASQYPGSQPNFYSRTLDALRGPSGGSSKVIGG
jgi:hypothetical protein